MNDDRFEHFDSAYLIGALSPEDRQAYEQHLPTCQACTDAVRRLSGLPGLMSRVPGADLADGVVPQPPATLLPDLLAVVGRERRRSRVRKLGLAAGLAAAVLAAAVMAGVLVSTRDDPAPARTPQTAMSAVGSSPLEVKSSVAGVAWGSRIDLTCTYDRAAKSWPSGITYSLVVVDRAGETHVAGSWAAVPDRVSHVRVATAVRPDDIARLEVRTGQGRTVLTWDR